VKLLRWVTYPNLYINTYLGNMMDIPPAPHTAKKEPNDPKKEVSHSRQIISLRSSS
jgi:hypothetical protein